MSVELWLFVGVLAVLISVPVGVFVWAVNDCQKIISDCHEILDDCHRIQRGEPALYRDQLPDTGREKTGYLTRVEEGAKEQRNLH